MMLSLFRKLHTCKIVPELFIRKLNERRLPQHKGMNIFPLYTLLTSFDSLDILFILLIELLNKSPVLLDNLLDELFRFMISQFPEVISIVFRTIDVMFVAQGLPC